MKHDIAVVGLGYVGLTFATALADVGFNVLGVEKRQDVVELTQQGQPHFSENGLESILKYVLAQGKLDAAASFPKGSEADIYVITVGTPLDASGQFSLDYIKAAAREVAGNMRDDALVILRSTVAIGTARDVVSPILAETGKKFQIAMCPERTLEGRAMQELRSLPQIIGADTDETRQRAAHFFYRLTPTVVQVDSLETAEIIKLVDNTYRDVQFGFANEVARICDAYGVNAMQVIDGGKLGYPRTKVALPGLVGGPCLEKDPHILAQSLARKGLTTDITKAARLVNERQPAETVAFLKSELARRVGESAKPLIAVAGIAFKGVPPTNDLRGSMALKVLEALREALPNAELRAFDPVCSIDQMQKEGVPADTFAQSLEEAVDGANCVVIANNHPDLGNMPPVTLAERLAPNGFIYDYWNHFSKHRAYEVGEGYFAVGNTRKVS